MEIKQWLVLDDIVYSSQYTLARMVCDYVADNIKNIDNMNEEDKTNFFLLYGAVNAMMNEDGHAVSNISLKNKILTRLTDKFITLTDGIDEWLLNKLPEDYKITTITSAMSALVGQTNVVYDNTSTMELLVMHAIGISEKINPTQLYTLDEMRKILDKQIETSESKDSRDSIFTANKELIERYADKLSIFIPKNYAHCRVKGADTFVEAWALDPDDTLKKESETKK